MLVADGGDLYGNGGSRGAFGDGVWAAAALAAVVRPISVR